MNSPTVFVTVEDSTFVSTLVTVTVAPGTDAPVESRTVPTTVPSLICPNPGRTNPNNKNSVKYGRNLCLRVIGNLLLKFKLSAHYLGY